jgi:hypothetical protein
MLETLPLLNGIEHIKLSGTDIPTLHEKKNYFCASNQNDFCA